MILTTDNYAETTNMKNDSDVLSDALGSMHIRGSILLNEDYLSPWGVAIPGADRLRGALKVENEARVVAFHFVKRGYIEITPEGGDCLTVEAGEIAICFGGVPHRLSQGPGKKTVSVESLLTGGINPFQPDENNRARSTSLMCGVFMLHNVELNPLFSSLPSVLHASAQRSGRLTNLPTVLNWMAQEADQMTSGSTYVVERLLELLCAEVLRAHLESGFPESRWLSGLKDPVVGKAISMIHSEPGECWSVDRLAKGVAMSPSRFAARFTAALGDSPMAYVTKWRMNLAGRLLGESRLGVSEIAADVGYENVAAFSRAFKRHLGVPPAAWRSRQC